MIIYDLYFKIYYNKASQQAGKLDTKLYLAPRSKLYIYSHKHAMYNNYISYKTM